MHGRRPHWLLIAMALLLAMGHVCALPGHAHGADRAAMDHEADGHRHPAGAGQAHPAPADEDSHLESCEALRSAPARLGVVPVASPQPVSITTVDGLPAGPHHRSVVVAESPPLFLLHASLRI